MTNDLMSYIDGVDWAQFSTAYGVADNVPRLLGEFASSDIDVAMRASHEIWCGLCHQHAYVSSAALPSYPILREILKSVPEKLVVEILDILIGFAQCSAPGFPDVSGSRPHWMDVLHSQMKEDLVIFEDLAGSKNEEIRQFAHCIVEVLNHSK